jgi:SAM-dependent methyltransferase
MSPSSSNAITVATRLNGLRCLTCTATTRLIGNTATCAACGNVALLTTTGVVEATAGDGDFIHEVDSGLDGLIRKLNTLDPPTCTEKTIRAHAEAAGLDIGNPVWEGRADLARLLPGAHGIAVDVGAGLGTHTIALARSARHVYALDRSLRRASLTAARARAEGLPNVTVAHADASRIPLASETCDLALLIGVLEWTGLGARDPGAAQRLVLSEIKRVLKPGGQLLIGIENRFGAQYFVGTREEHTNLRFGSLLPRRLANAYSRALRHCPMTNHTYSRAALLELVRGAGLQARLGFALPSYSEPQFSFDANDAHHAWSFYFRHIYHYSSGRRRLAGCLGRIAHPSVLARVAPTFWLVAEKGGSPPPMPTIVTGSADCAGDIKVIDWDAEYVLRFPRTNGGHEERSRLVAGWNARSWVSCPLLRRSRSKRQSTLVAAAVKLFAARQRQAASEDVFRRCLTEAFAAIDAIETGLAPETERWCRDRLLSLAREGVAMVEEHSDFVLVNLVVEAPMTLRDIDKRSDTRLAIVGADALSLAADLLCLSLGLKHHNVDVALTAMLKAPAGVAREIYRLLWGDFGADTPILVGADLTLMAILRYRTNNGPLPGLVPFLDRCAAGELDRALRRLVSFAPNGVWSA